ncbi:hypothetical protein M3J09_003502 [Ascochyta lentis]
MHISCTRRTFLCGVPFGPHWLCRDCNEKSQLLRQVSTRF